MITRSGCCWGRLASLAIVFLIGAAPLEVLAQDNYADILRAFNEVAEKGPDAGARSQAIALKHNKMLQELSINGKIPPRTFQANQANFERIVDSHLHQAAARNNVRYTPQVKAPNKVPTPGTDTDAIASSLDGKPINAQQVTKTRRDFDRGIQKFLNKNGAGSGPAPDLNVSVMPDPGSMTKSEWQKAIDTADAAGEVVYKNPAAAAAEAKMRSGKPVSVAEANARVQEMQRLSKEHFNAADEMAAAARKLPPGPQRQALESQAQIMRHNGAKYVNRINETGNYIAKQNNLPPVNPQPDDVMTAAAIRSADGAKDAAAAGAMSAHYTAKATESFVDNLANIARTSSNPGAVMQAQDGIAKALNALPPAQQGNMIDALRRSNGDQFAQHVAKRMRSLPKPSYAPAPSGKISKALKVLGPLMTAYEGYKGLKAVATSDDASYEAGKQLGGFTGGQIGGWAGVAAGAWAGAKAGGLASSWLGPAGAVVGGIIGGVAGGYVGYSHGSAHGREMGDTNSKYWDKNKPQEEFNRIARKNGLDTPDGIYDKLRGMGVSEAEARQAKEAYERGSLKTFQEQLRAIREKMQGQGQWSPTGFRRFGDLGENEVSDLLHCLCSASLGANPWVAQGYNLTIPEGYIAGKHSCGSLAGGPCMAQGFGCWRSFIDLNSERAQQCMEAYGLQANKQTLSQLDKFNQAVEEPFEVELTVEPKAVCPGDRVTVTASAKGGRGGYNYQYEAGTFLKDGVPEGDTRRTSFTITIDPALTRGGMGPEGLPTVNTRPAEAYRSYVGVIVRTAANPDAHYAQGRFADGKQEVVQVKAARVPVTLRSHADCQQEQPPSVEEKKEKEQETGRVTEKRPARTPSVSGRTPVGPGPVAVEPGAGKTSAPPYLPPPERKRAEPKAGAPAGTPPPGDPAAEASDAPKQPSAPDEHLPDTAPPDEDTEPEPEPPPEPDCDACLNVGGGIQRSMEDGPSGTTVKGEKTYWVEGCEGQTVRITVTGSDGWTATATGQGERATVARPLGDEGGEDEVTVENLSIPDCTRSWTSPFGPLEPKAEAVPEEACDECLSIGGGKSATGQGATGADGRTVAITQATQTYWVEGCPGQTVRISATGSDGWTASAEATDQRASITRKIGHTKGVDTITVENLSLTGCSRTFDWPFEPADSLRDAEAVSSEEGIVSGDRTLDAVRDARAQRATDRVGAGLESMQVNADAQRAATSGDDLLNQAQSVRDGGGQDAARTREEGARQVREGEGKSVLVEGIVKGVEQGLVEAASTFGSQAGQEVGSAIFEGPSRPDTTIEETAPSSTPAASGAHPHSSAARKATTSAKGEPGSGEAAVSVDPGAAITVTEPDTAAEEEPQIYVTTVDDMPTAITTPACGFCDARPATSVTTAEGDTVYMCSTCKSRWTCSVCGKVTTEIGGASYQARDATGQVIWSGSISRVCTSCSAEWMREQKAKWEQ